AETWLFRIRHSRICGSAACPWRRSPRVTQSIRSALPRRQCHGGGAGEGSQVGARPLIMASNPSVSVALATYNGAPHLAAQLGDLANQSLPPRELVACDDGSSDDTLAILSDFADNAPFPVRIHRNPA